MEHEPQDPALEALFDRTSEEPDAIQMTRLKARALDVPERARRRPRWLPRWAWAPGLASLAVAVGALVAALGLPGGSDELAATSLSVAVAPPPLPRTSSPALVTEPEASDELNDEELVLVSTFGAAFDFGPEEEPLLDPFSEPTDAELDAWMAASAALLEEPELEP